ncbi:hypothetical protein MKK58_16310 [Methylobacterium sp. J-078]|jgi:hypothetical protein|uniref:hypothetical protein n=1 Tax=Methylobacterium sp. J-078 TaxID=2836657 RepID=UPI001FBB0F35|nr:hypothetical protein [Methylobacterium sp. J-078]MCJ2046078.1 hypothetical protein [Methylobacterium sp. J-078]
MPVPLAAAIRTEAPASPSRFIVGQDPQGRWVALEVHGLGGGLFRTRHDALHYATDLTGRRPGAVEIATDRIELRL